MNSGLLCVFVGNGVQIFGMTLTTMIIALLGFLSPTNPDGLMTALFFLWVFMGLFAGYSSARLYKSLKGTEWKKNTLKPVAEDPVKTHKIPRQVPEQAWYIKPVFSILIGVILPFGVALVELFFITLTSVWLNQFYHIFVAFVTLIITCAEITVVMCYFQLCNEDYNWWWRAYLTAGSSALYFFLYSIFYSFVKLNITKLVSGILCFGYILIASYALFSVIGTIGFYACLWFVRRIYSSLKID